MRAVLERPPRGRHSLPRFSPLIHYELVARVVSADVGGSRRGPLFYLGIAPGAIAP